MIIRPELIINNNKKENLQNCGLCYYDWTQSKVERKQKEGYVPGPCLGTEKLWNIKVTVGDLGTVTKGLVQGLEDLKTRGRVETIQTTELLRSARILRGVLETWGYLLSLRPSANINGKNLKGVKIIIIISLTLYHHSSLSYTASGRSTRATSHIGTELLYFCRFWLVVLPLLVRVKGSTGLHHLWVRPNFSSSVLHVWYV